MLRRLLAGSALALCAAVAVLLGGGSNLEHVGVLGVALGGVVGLVSHDPPWGKVSGFLLGFFTMWIVFGVRALLLPDTTVGRAVAAFLVVLVCAVVAAVTAGRMPLWSALVGVAAMIGAYEMPFDDSMPQFLVTSPPAATAVLFAAGLGFIVATLIDLFIPAPGANPTGPRHSTPDKDPEMLERLMTGEPK